MEHPQIQVILNNGKKITVDKHLADLVKDLNDRGFTTCNSCQNNYGNIWIQFSSLEKYRKFREFALFDAINRSFVDRQKGEYGDTNNLSGFLDNHVKEEMLFSEASSPDDDYILDSTGIFPSHYELDDSVSIRFDKSKLEKFKQYYRNACGKTDDLRKQADDSIIYCDKK